MPPENRKPTTILIPALCILLCCILWGCSDSQVVDKTVRDETPAHVLRARAWADTMLAQLSTEEKIAQLIFLQAPFAADTNVQTAFADSVGRGGYGGIVLPDAHRLIQREISFRSRKASRLPLWVALDADAGWSDIHDYPDLRSVAATGDDSLALDWGRAIAAESRWLGASFVMVSAGKLSPDSLMWRNSFGSVDTVLHSHSNLFLQGLRKSGVQPCVRMVPDRFELRPDSGQAFPALAGTHEALRTGIMRTVEPILRQTPIPLQLSFTRFPDVDSALSPYSERIMGVLLRQGLDFQDLIFSPNFDRGYGESDYATGTAEARALRAGCDLIVGPRSPEAVIEAIRKQLEDGTFETATLDARVKNVLYQKALAGLDTLPVWADKQLEALNPRIRLEEMNRRLSEKALTLLRDQTNRLPLRGHVAESRIATLSIGTYRKTHFQSDLDAYAPMRHFTLSKGLAGSKSKYDSFLYSFRRDAYVIVSLHPDAVAEGDTLRATTRAFLGALDDKTRLVLVNFAGPRALHGLDTLNCIVHVWDDKPMRQRVAAQYVFGGVTASGQLPFTINAHFKAGDGLARTDKLRLAFVAPEALGVDPRVLDRIDSIVRTAMYSGTFPGCQILAAKDGQVFYHKAFGHHDYTRQRRVRLHHLYDIASVTKIVSTTLMAMQRYDQDTFHLDKPLKDYCEELDSNWVTIRDITPQQLMVHQAGLPPSLPVYYYYTLMDSVDSLRAPVYADHKDSLHDVQIAKNLYFNSCYEDSIFGRVCVTRLAPPRYVYSDMSMYLMKLALERNAGVALDTFVDSVFYKPMGLQHTCYLPLDHFDLNEITPTEDDRWFRRQLVHGYVHDPSTALLGGVGGQAGVFSNAQDIGTIMQMLLNGGKYGGIRFVKPSTVRKFASRQPGSHRGLGFDMQKPNPEPDRGHCCQSANEATFGHLGWTGTCAWADPEHDIVFVFLSNRVYPKGRNFKINRYRVRQNIQETIYQALGLSKTFAVDSVFNVELYDDSTLVDSLPPDSIQ